MQKDLMGAKIIQHQILADTNQTVAGQGNSPEIMLFYSEAVLNPIPKMKQIHQKH